MLVQMSASYSSGTMRAQQLPAAVKPIALSTPVAFRGSRSTSVTSRRLSSKTLATETPVLQLDTALDSLANPLTPNPEASSSYSKPEPINWYQQWYPLAIVKDLDPRRPSAAKILGVPVVVWKDGAGQWSVMEDRCPHRLAPLSEGRIDADGTLMCSYHGWQFNSQGSCTRIPQIEDDKAHATACSSKKSCVASFPVKVLDGLLWVWPDASSAGAAATAAAAVIPELNQPDEWEPRTDWFMRDMPISMETVVENVTDPCHANFTHHKVQGARSAEKGTAIRPLTPPSPAGFKLEQDSGRFKATFEFQAPCFLKYEFPVFGRVMAVYIIPTEKGHSRMITRFIKNKKSFTRRPGLMGLFLRVMELVEGNRVLEHVLMRNKVLDGDGHILHIQERQLLSEGVSSWQKNYYMPGTSDTGVAAWRSWLTKYGAAMPLLPQTLDDLPPLMDRRETLDRYHQHTKNCPDCMRALKRVDTALPLTWAAAAAALLIAGVSTASGAPLLSANVAGATAAAAILALLFRGLKQFRQLFFFTDYVHADVA